MTDYATTCARGAVPTDPGPVSDARLAEVFPSFRDTVVSPRAIAAMRAGMGLARALDAACGRPRGEDRFSPGHLRRMRSADWGDMTSETKRRVLRMVSTFPPNWFPSTPDEARAARDLQPLHEGIERLLGDARPAFAACKGRWSGFLDGATARSGLRPADLKRIPALMSDAADDLCRTVALPNLALAGGSREPDLAPALAASRPAAARILFGGRGLHACITVQTSWHDGTAGMLARPLGKGVVSGTWKGLTRPWRSPDGIDLVPLRSGTELAAEGAALDHCAASYGLDCLTGSSHVVSLRLDGRPLSTAEFALPSDGMPRLRQHSGPGNARPDPRDGAAVRAYLRGIATGEIPVLAEPMADGARDWPDLETACGYDWRSPVEVSAATAAYDALLPRRLRGMGPAGWAAEAARAIGMPVDLPEA